MINFKSKLEEDLKNVKEKIAAVLQEIKTRQEALLGLRSIEAFVQSRLDLDIPDGEPLPCELPLEETDTENDDGTTDATG